MNLIEEKIAFHNEEFILNNQRSLYWESHDALILSDLHLGKAGHFRKHGIAIPHQVTENDIRRLDLVLEHYTPKKIIIVGDLIHASSNKDFELFQTMRKKFSSTNFTLIGGNHDRGNWKLFSDLGIDEQIKEINLNNIVLIHDRDENQQGITISGHLHPGIRIPLTSKTDKAFPCFTISHKALILPAFSSFTGLSTHWPMDVEYTHYAFDEKNFFKITQRSNK